MRTMERKRQFRGGTGIRFLLVFAALAGLFALLVPHAALAQAGNADVVGTVTDTSGAVIPNATVTVHNTGTGIDRVVTSNEKGDYLATLLPNGQYSLKVEAKGFTTYSVQSFALGAGASIRFDAKLQPGAVTQEVKVDATVEQALQTDTATVSGTIDSQATQDLPLNNRNIQGALTLLPGVTPAATSGSQFGVADRRPSVDVNINGQMSTYNNNLIDGFDNNERNNGFAGVRPSIDGIGEMKVESSVSNADIGRAGGGSINLITKSGTNKFHGSGFEYFRNEDLDANGYLFGGGKVQGLYRQNIFGGNIGGPVWIPKVYDGHNKTFFFFDFEMGRLLQGTPTQITLPTSYEMDHPGDFSDVEFYSGGGPPPPPGQPAPVPTPGVNLNDGFVDTGYGLQTTGRTDGKLGVDPIALKMWSWIPRNRTLDAAAQTKQCPWDPSDPSKTYTCITPKNYVSASPTTQRTRTWSVRIDHHFSDKDLIFGRYADNPVYTYYPGYFPQITEAAISAGIYSQAASEFVGIYPGGNNNNFPGPSDTKSRNLQLDYIHIFSPSLVMDLKAGYSRISIVTLPLNYGIGAATKLGLPNVYNPEVPSTDVLPIWDLGEFQLGSSNDVPKYSVNNNFQYAGSLTYTRGSHTFKFGSGVIRRQLLDFNNQEGGGAFPTPQPMIPNLSNVAQWMTGYSQVQLRAVSLVAPHFRTWESSYYVQDNWRVNSKLTLNLGLRYDLFTPWKEANNQMANFDIDTFTYILAKNDSSANCSACKVSDTIGVKTAHTDFSPRVGFAYSLDSKTVIRGGYGLSWYPLEVGTSSGGTSPSNMIALPNAPYGFVYAYTPGSPGYVPPHWSAGPVEATLTGINYSGQATAPIAGGPNNGQPTGYCAQFYDPTTFALLDAANTPYDCNQNVTSINVRPSTSRPFMVQQMNLTVQRQFGAYTATVGFVEVISNGMGRALNFNQPDPPCGLDAPGKVCDTPTANYKYLANLPYVQSIGGVYNANNGNYSAVQAILDRTFKQGLKVNANYTFAHALDTTWSGSSPVWASNSKYDYGNSGLDIRQRFVMTMNYTLPFAKSSSSHLVRLALKDWQLVGTFVASSGSPFGVTDNTHPPFSVAAGVPGLTSDRPNRVPGESLTVSNRSLDKWFNTEAFAVQTAGTAGTAAKNLMHGPGSRNSDLALHKNFELTEGVQMQFRAEAFNFANLHNWGNPGSNISDPSTLGVISSTNGSPRNLQLALKLMF
jgi:hypothetical protein